LPADDLAAVAVRGPGSAFEPLRDRNFRLLWAGMLVSQTGSWMQFTALGYLLDQLTKAPVYLGLLGLSQAIPRLLFALIGGVAADRFDRRRVLMSTNLVLMGSAALLGVLAYTGRIQVWHILVIGAFNSMTQSFDAPARQSMIPTLVSETHLMRAVSLSAMALNGSGVFGPSFGGVLIALTGVAGCFFVNALSYTAVLAALLRMDVPPQAAGGGVSFRRDFLEGLSLLGRHRPLLAVLGVIGVLSFFGRPYIRLMPALAREVLHVGPQGLGVLQSAVSLGAILAVFVVGMIGHAVPRGRILLTTATVAGATVVLVGFSRWFAASAALLVIAGINQALALASANTLLQTTVQPEQRGRIMGLYSMVNFGMFALGTLPMGALAGVIGVGPALSVGGAIVIALTAGLTLATPVLRRL
jgi:MFS family permease